MTDRAAIMQPGRILRSQKQARHFVSGSSLCVSARRPRGECMSSVLVPWSFPNQVEPQSTTLDEGQEENEQGAAMPCGPTWRSEPAPHTMDMTCPHYSLAWWPRHSWKNEIRSRKADVRAILHLPSSERAPRQRRLSLRVLTCQVSKRCLRQAPRSVWERAFFDAGLRPMLGSKTTRVRPRLQDVALA